MNQQIRISAKNLGAVALADFCERCFWIKLRMANKLPFQIFPGIFSSIDSYTKKCIHAFFDQHGRAPEWMSELGELVGYRNPPSYHHFNIVVDQHNIMLTGSPDGVLVRPDGSIVIVDYKTARYTSTQDQLYPMYDAQLNAYAMIGEQRGLAPVSALALLYMEPVTDDAATADHSNRRDDGFAMGFSANVHLVKRNTELVRRLLAQTRKIFELGVMPSGCPGCKDCRSLDGLLQTMNHHATASARQAHNEA